MTRDEGVAAIQLQMSFRTTLDSEIVTAMQMAQTMLEAEPMKPWFLISEDAYIRTEADDDRIPIPDDFLEEVDEAVLRYVPDDTDDDQVDLKKDDYDTLRKNYADPDTGGILTGPPEAYALLGNYFRLFPTPDDDYLIRQIYYQQDDTLDTNIENEWLKHVPFLLLGRAGLIIALGPVRDMVAAQVFKEWIAEGRAILTAKNISRSMAGRELQVGGPH